MAKHGEEYYKREADDFLKELKSGKLNRAVAAHLGIREHFVVRNGKKVPYESTCDHDCLDEHRLDNGLRCPRRVSCLIENGYEDELPKSVVEEYKAKQTQYFNECMNEMGLFENRR